MVKEQGAVPVEEVEVVHHHFSNLLSEKKTDCLSNVWQGCYLTKDQDVKQAAV